MLEQPHETIEDYDDFYVMASMVDTLIYAVEDEMKKAGIAFPEVADGDLTLTDDILKGIPESFCDDEPEDWNAALPLYWIIFNRLLDVFDDHDRLVCGWSA